MDEQQKLEQLVDEFAKSMKIKLLYQLKSKNFYGWEKPNWTVQCGGKIIEKAEQLVYEHDFDQAIDLANYTMFYKFLQTQSME